MEMITAKEYANKIKRFDLNELIEERKKLLSSIDYLEKLNESKNKEIYMIKLGYLVECIKMIQKKLNKTDFDYIDNDELHEGDIVKIHDKEYKISIVVDKNTGIKKLSDVLEIHVKAKNVDDYKFIKRAFNRYKKDIE